MASGKMTKVTIPREMGFDPYFRYKRIVLSTEYIKKYGCSTVLKNGELQKLAHDLGRSLDELIQWIRKRINTSISLDKDGRRWLIKRQVTQTELDDHVEEFIHQYVLCSICDNPETEKLNNGIQCKACGFLTQIK